MCLYSKDWYGKEPSNEGTGWKILYRCKLTNELVSPFQITPFKMNKWKTDKKNVKLRYKATNDNYYPCGFHIFPTRREARNYLRNFDDHKYYKVYKVKYKNLVARGTQILLNVLVVKSIKIER